MPTCCTLVASNDSLPATTLSLRCGIAEAMGDGLFIVFQTDDLGQAQSVVICADDLRALLAVA